MKPRIVTLDGIYVQNRDGFYELEEHPEQRSATWMYWWAVLALVAIGGFVWWLR